MGKTAYEVVFGTAFTTGLIAGITVAFGMDIDPLHLALGVGDQLVNAVNGATQIIQPTPTPGPFDLQKLWGDIKAWVLLIDALVIVVALLAAFKNGIVGLFCFGCGLVGGFLLPVGVKQTSSFTMILAAVLIVIGGAAAWYIEE